MKQHSTLSIWYDVLTPFEIQELKNWAPALEWRINPPKPVIKLLNIARVKFPKIDDAIGYECWINELPLPPHQDKDEKLYLDTNITIHPICSLVYYLEVKNLHRGLLHIENHGSIEPVENSLIAFDSSMYHWVEPYRGRRVSLAINPWDRIPLKYVENLG